jgi:antirestriction protein
VSALEPRVYIACLGCYNAGCLHGEWFDADDELPGKVAESFGTSAPGDDEEPTILCHCIAQLGREGAPDVICGGEEFVVHDSEGFGFMKIGEVGYEEAAEVGQKLRDLGDDAELVTAVFNHLGSGTSLDDAETFYRDNYQGAFDSLEDWAYDSYEQCGDIPKGPLASYLGGGKVHVFLNG